MMPYFFASGHMNYARYGICYLRTMHKLPKCILEAFMRGEHVMRHQDGIWNGIWSDMMIETTYMRYGKGPGGIIGVTTQPRTVQIWTESLPACTEVLKDLDEVRGKNSKVKSYHKEESNTRITNDLKDRIKLRDALQLCAHPFDPESNRQNLLINIYTGEIAPEECNVQRSLEIGSKQLSDFVSHLPDGFYSTIQKKVITMACKPKRKDLNVHEAYNTEMLYSRVMCLLSVNQISLDDLFKYELSPIPLSMFKATGEGRFPSNKSSLKKKFKVEVSKRNIKTDAVIIDGCAALYHVHWPKEAKVQDFVDTFIQYISKFLQHSTVFLTFDRYRDYSIKGQTRLKRLGNHLRTHVLTLETPLPPKEMTLKSSKTKIQLINLICDSLLNYFTIKKCQQSLFITGQDDVPSSTCKGVQQKRDDMRTTHEEADVIIPLQVQCAMNKGYKNIQVICDDTDVFVLLVYYHHVNNWENDVLLTSLDESNKPISIKLTAKKHAYFASSLPAMHVLSMRHCANDVWNRKNWCFKCYQEES